MCSESYNGIRCRQQRPSLRKKRMNQNVCQNVLTTVVNHWNEEDAQESNTAFKKILYQHTRPEKLRSGSRMTFLTTCDLQTLLAIILLTIMYGAVERVTNKTACNNKDELRKRICQVLQDLSPEVIKCAYSHLLSCLEAVINTEGGFIE